MLKKLMCGLVLAVAAMSASAQSLWQFSYTGFFYTPSNQFMPDWTEGGFFEVWMATGTACWNARS